MLRANGVAIKDIWSDARLLSSRCFHGLGGHFEDLGVRGSVGDALADLLPKNRTIGEHDKHRWNGEVSTLLGDAPLQCHAQVLVLEQWEWQFEGLRQFGGFFARVDTDRSDLDTSFAKDGMQICQLPELDTTIRSPIAAVKHDDGRAVGSQISERDLFAR